ncbi:Hypothetical protein ETEE_3780 [Edwardsiella anguillarum ET080813]|uniref:Uncharacterized protein n=1 Tax=Edwardsiella anguillarum ET080813 TaxID=667120 RepID=A0A076LU20_9GAMM|nr:Hypothetical protein ETEE_3780 [Edwardsiella anguillarum ET080813]
MARDDILKDLEAVLVFTENIPASQASPSQTPYQEQRSVE